MTGILAALLAAIVALVSTASCSIIDSSVDGLAAAPPVSGPYPLVCDALGFGEMRCRATVARAMERAGILGRPVGSIELIEVVQPEPECGTASDGSKILCVRSGGGMWTGVLVRFELADDGSFAAEIRCGMGNSDDQECNDSGLPPMHGTGVGGYWDVPCYGEQPAGCATPFPSPDPATLARARGLELTDLSIPVGDLGHHQIEVGRARLANGLISEMVIEPGTGLTDAIFGEDGVAVEVRPIDPTRPAFTNAYERGTVEGVEEVVVYLVFDVIDTRPRATLSIARILVR